MFSNRLQVVKRATAFASGNTVFVFILEEKGVRSIFLGIPQAHINKPDTFFLRSHPSPPNDKGARWAPCSFGRAGGITTVSRFTVLQTKH